MVKVPTKSFLRCFKRENDQKGHHQEWSLRLNLVFGHFHEFGTSGCLNIEYFDIPKQSKRFGVVIRHVLHNLLA